MTNAQSKNELDRNSLALDYNSCIISSVAMITFVVVNCNYCTIHTTIRSVRTARIVPITSKQKLDNETNTNSKSKQSYES